MNKKIVLTLITSLVGSFVFSSCSLSSNEESKKEQEPSPSHIHDYQITHVEPTCEEDGYTLHECSCGDSFKDEVVTKIGHNYEQKHDSNNHWEECSHCHKQINKVEHDYKINTTLPTCTSRGYTTYVCDCGYSYIDNYVDELKHEYIAKYDKNNHWEECTLCNSKVNIEEHKFTTELVEPTCEEGGYTIYTCKCGYTYNDNFTQKLDHSLIDKHNENQHWEECIRCNKKFNIENHDFVHSSLDPTCEHEGLDIYTCKCGYSYSEKSSDPLEHEIRITYNETYHFEHCANCDYEKQELHNLKETVVEATCIESGYTKYECDCGYTKIVNEVPALNHNYELKSNAETHFLMCSRCNDVINVSKHQFTTVTVLPTCEESGYTVYTCDCGYTYKDNFVDEHGHKYIGQYDTNYHYKECEYCFDVIDKKEHYFTDKIVDPTCLEKGYTLHSCECGYSFKDTYVDALDHDYVAKYDENKHWMECSRCKDIINKEDHELDTKVVDPTCTKPGYTEHFCECGYSYLTDNIDAKGHNTEKLDAIPATKTSTGLTEGLWCKECGDILVEQKTTYYLEVESKGSNAEAVQFASNSVVPGETVTLKVPSTNKYFFGYKVNGTFVCKEHEYSFVMPSSNISVLAIFTEYPNCDIWNGSVATKFASGDGSQSNPYIISSGAELAYLAKIVNENNEIFDGYYKLVKNIDISFLPWTPIGNLLSKDKTSKYNFAGHFDGNDCTIFNLNFLDENISCCGEYIGLFGYVASKAEISNLKITNSSIDITETSGNYYIGLLAGYLGTYGIVKNCSIKQSSIYISGSTASSSNKSYAGSMFGYVDKYSELTNCLAKMTIDIETSNSAPSYYGGLVGYGDQYIVATQLTSESGSTNITNRSPNSRDGIMYIGGVFGYLDSYKDKTKLVNNSNIFVFSCSDVYVGGLIGSFGNSTAETKLIKSENHGSIHVDNSKGLFCGGLVGTSSGVKAIACYNDGSIQCCNVSDKAYVGGIAGKYINSYCCYHNGKIDVEMNGDNTCYFGGIVGNEGSCDQCYACGSFTVKNLLRKYAGVYLNGISNSAGSITNCYSSVTLSLTIETLTLKDGVPKFPSSIYLGYLCGYNSKNLSVGNGCSNCSCSVNGYSFANGDTNYIDNTITKPADIEFDTTYWYFAGGSLFPILTR